MVDLTDLCIETGKAVWCLYVDIICIADGGSVLDASVIALSSALKSGKYITIILIL
jgi:exosome complex component RRP43